MSYSVKLQTETHRASEEVKVSSRLFVSPGSSVMTTPMVTWTLALSTVSTTYSPHLRICSPSVTQLWRPLLLIETFPSKGETQVRDNLLHQLVFPYKKEIFVVSLSTLEAFPDSLTHWKTTTKSPISCPDVRHGCETPCGVFPPVSQIFLMLFILNPDGLFKWLTC